MRIGLRHRTDGRYFPLPGDQILVGSSGGCDIRLDDDGVAGEHAQMRVSRLGIEIDDLSTPAGSFVNGYRIGRHFLARNDELRFGTAVCVLEFGEDRPAEPRCRRCGAEIDPERDEPKDGKERPPGSSSAIVCALCARMPRQRTGSSRLTPAPRASGGLAGEDAVGEETEHIVTGTSRLPPAPPAGFRRTPEPGRALEPRKADACDILLREYESLGVLGEGAQGKVYKLRHRESGKLVAAKSLTSVSVKAVRRFEREAEALRRLRHESIVGLIDLRRGEGTAILLMEYAEGPSVAALIERDGRVEARLALRMGGEVARALAYAAGQGVVHRDVKPSNIVVPPSGPAKLTDFGLVSLADSETKLTVEGRWLGTPRYMAPEQFTGAPVDGRTDVWGLGAALFHALTGVLPFEAWMPAELYRKITTEPCDRKRLEAAAGAKAAELVGRTLSKKREERPAAEELARALEQLSRGA